MVCIIKRAYDPSAELSEEETLRIRDNIRSVRARLQEAALRSGRAADAVQLMAVTKTVPPAKIQIALEEGLSLFGENRVQEICEKKMQINLLNSQIHFIGHLQTNKIRDIINKVSCVQSVDSFHLATALSAAAVRENIFLPCLLEINIGGESSKSGFAPEAMLAAAEEIDRLPGLQLRGLMTVQPSEASRSGDDRYFKQMQQLFFALREQLTDPDRIDTLSMGMSGDYETAVRCGATMVRIGQGIFGARTMAAPNAPKK